MPSATSRLLMVAGLRRPWKRVRSATSGPPGRRRGRMKLRVSAAQSVTTKNSSRRIRYRIPYIVKPARRRSGRAAGAPPSVFTRMVSVLAFVHLQEHLFPVGNVPGRRRCIGVVLRRPTRQRFGVVLVPGDAFRHRNHRDLLEHDPLDLVHDLVLLAAVRGARKLLDQPIGGSVGKATVVAGRLSPARS